MMGGMRTAVMMVAMVLACWQMTYAVLGHKSGEDWPLSAALAGYTLLGCIAFGVMVPPKKKPPAGRG